MAYGYADALIKKVRRKMSDKKEEKNYKQLAN